MSKSIIIPFRGTISDKSRLHSVLNHKMLEKLLSLVTQRVIKESLQVEGINQVYILTQRDRLPFQGEYKLLKDKGNDLNSSVFTAIEEVHEKIVVIVMADLPLITSDKIQEIIQEHIKSGKVVLAPTEDKGTSVLCFDKQCNFPGLFGKESSMKFIEYYNNNSVGVSLMEYDEAYRDIDTFKDLIKIANNESLAIELHSIIKECVKFEREN